jgi:predicted aminopeptidase
LSYLPSNNAELAMFSTYYLWVPAWQQQWRSCEDALKFLKYTEYLARLHVDERLAVLGNNNCDANEEFNELLAGKI